jgi:uncharacterized protein (DUF4415 family)
MPKQAISIRLDQSIIDWFKANHENYQTAINNLLRDHVAKLSNPDPDYYNE